MELYTSHGAIISTAMLLVSDSILGKLYTYTPDGIRSSKTVNGTKTEYLLNGTQILAQKTGSDVMWFFYDSTGTRIGVQQGNVTAYYMYNLQGDVVGLADAATGKIIAKYLYDAWGKCVSVENADGYTIGTANPFRYCGYYYDNETGLYYLQSRYYDPTIARFINADGYLSTGATGLLSHNMFAYCENNPIMCSDPTGESTKVTDIETICYKVDDDGTAYYSTAISFETKLKCRNYDYYRPTVTVSGAYVFEYKIDANGVIRFDNNQPDSSSLQNPIICKALAKEMRNISRKQVHGALKGRTVDGIARELKYHKIANWFLPSLESAKVTDIGALYKNSIGYDYNAKLFENGDFIATIKEMLK